MMSFSVPSLHVSCALALLAGACGVDSTNTQPGADGSLRVDAGRMSDVDGGHDPDVTASDGATSPAHAGDCFEANEPFDAKAAIRFAKVDPDQVGRLLPLNERLFLYSSESLFEIVPGKSDPVLVVENIPGAAHLFGKTWYFVDGTTAWRMDAGAPGTTPTMIRTDLVESPTLRIVGETAVYQQLETGVQVFPFDGSPAFMLAGVRRIEGGVEHAGLFYYFDRDAERPFRVEPKPGAAPEVLSAGDDTFGDFGGDIATNGKYTVWDIGSGRLKGAPIGKPSEVSSVASVPTQASLNKGVYDLTFVGDQLYFSFYRTEADPKGGRRTFSNIGYATLESDACGVVVSDLWGFDDGKYEFTLTDSTLWIMGTADGSVYSRAL